MLIAVEGLLRLECLFRSRRLSRRFEDLPPAARLYPTPDQFGSFSPFLHGRAALSWADASPWPHRSGICIPAIPACHPNGLLRRTAAVRCPRQRLICPDEVSIDGRGEPLLRLTRTPRRKTRHRSEAHNHTRAQVDPFKATREETHQTRRSTTRRVPCAPLTAKQRVCEARAPSLHRNQAREPNPARCFRSTGDRTDSLASLPPKPSWSKRCVPMAQPVFLTPLRRGPCCPSSSRR